jgi:hypothetical protein
MRSFVILTFALALALAPAAAFAQTPPTQPPPTQPPTQPPAGQPPATQPPAETKPEPPKLTFTTSAGLLLVQVKPDQTATFEEMISKIKSGLAASTDESMKTQAASWKVYKSSDPAAGNVLYLVMIEPVTPNAEYSFLQVLHKTLTPEQQRDPATQEMYKRYAAAIATMNIVNINKVGGE